MGGFFVPHDLAAPLAGAASGPLRGLSGAVKDMYAIAGHRTGGGNPAWLERAAPADRHCPVVERLLAAGAVIVGKTICDEFFFSLSGTSAHYGTPANVRAPGRIPGGSSSGSAAAVAAGACDFAIGSDTGGSVRVPAALCGVFGIRTSHGRVPLDGAMAMAPSFDTVGWFAPGAGVLAKVGDALLDGEGGVRGVVSTLLVAEDGFEEADPAVAAVLAGALPAIARALVPPRRVRIAPDGLEAWRETFRVVQGFEVWEVYGGFITAHAPAMAADVAARMTAASRVTRHEAEVGLAAVAAARRHLQTVVTPGTVVVLPTAPCIAPEIGSSDDAVASYRTRTMRLTAIAGLGGLPQVSIPIATVSGCPVGLSLIGWRGGDEALLDTAVTLQRLCGGFQEQ